MTTFTDGNSYYDRLQVENTRLAQEHAQLTAERDAAVALLKWWLRGHDNCSGPDEPYHETLDFLDAHATTLTGGSR
jgi:hypothetical protein